jgi:predicted small lipoprotein YifL
MPTRALIILLVAVAALGGCGRRGALQAPHIEKSAVPAAADEVAGPSEGVSPLDPGSSGTGEKVVPPKANKDRHFFLDFLL